MLWYAAVVVVGLIGALYNGIGFVPLMLLYAVIAALLGRWMWHLWTRATVSKD